MTTVVPECEFELDEFDELYVDCDRAATHEFTIKDLPNPYSSRRGLVCAEHLDAVMGHVDPTVATIRDLSVPQLHRLSDTVIDGSKVLTGLIGSTSVTTDRVLAGPIDVEQLHAGRVPAGWECTRIPNHEGPCALRELQPVGIATIPVPATYRPSKWSTPWVFLLGLIGYELWAVATSKPGGPLSHLVWWAYGDRWSLRWWLASMGMNGLGVWAAAHFMFEKWEVRELGVCVFFGLLLGMVGYIFTAVTR